MIIYRATTQSLVLALEIQLKLKMKTETEKEITGIEKLAVSQKNILVLEKENKNTTHPSSFFSLTDWMSSQMF